MNEDLLDAWSFGLAAGFAQEDGAGNPFPDGTNRAHCWREGWRLGLQCSAKPDAKQEKHHATSRDHVIPVTASPSP